MAHWASWCFRGGAGTAEEILYLTGILLDPANQRQPFPIVLTGPAASAAYFEHILPLHRRDPRGGGAVRRLAVVVDDPAEVARRMVNGMDAVREFPPPPERFL